MQSLGFLFFLHVSTWRLNIFWDTHTLRYYKEGVYAKKNVIIFLHLAELNAEINKILTIIIREHWDHLKLQTNILLTCQNFSQPFWQERTVKIMTDIVFIMKISVSCYKNYSVMTSKWGMYKELKSSTASVICSPKTTCYFEQLFKNP